MQETYELYHSELCGFCHRVRRYMAGAGWDFPLQDTLRDRSARSALVHAPGEAAVYGDLDFIVLGALAEQVLASVPDHPGAHHYIIHAYDNPELSAGAVDAAAFYHHSLFTAMGARTLLERLAPRKGGTAFSAG